MLKKKVVIKNMVTGNRKYKDIDLRLMSTSTPIQVSHRRTTEKKR
jgi:hypothetical protein